MTDDQFRKIAERNIAAINAATEGLPADRMRLHICWGNYEGPHTHDLPLLKIIDLAFKARPQAISIEAANRATITNGRTSRTSISPTTRS